MSPEGKHVAIIGAGNVGSILGGALLQSGKAFQVKYGVRDPSAAKYKKLLNHQVAATVSSVHEAVAWADCIILATPGMFEDEELETFAASLGPDVEGKVIIDATNSLSAYPGLESRVWKHGTSGGEVLAAALPDAFVYKAFNSIGAEHMAHADGSEIWGAEHHGEPLTMLFAGAEDSHHREAAEAVISGVGFKPMYVGPIRYARNLEAMAELWVHLGVEGIGSKETWGRNFHFQVMKKKE